MNFKVGSLTDIGRRRQQNQDAFAAEEKLGIFVVADGMGGHRGGEIASALAAQNIPEAVKELLESGHTDPKQIITHAVLRANQAIFDHALKHIELQGMGTTTTALFFKDGMLTIGHVGDSRCYFLRPGRVWQATRDHSLVQEKLRAGIITREQAKHDRMKNIITRSVGYEPEVEVEVYQIKVERGDSFVICSDGLSGQISDETLLEIVQEHLYDGGDATQAVKQLIETANRNGGDDNITAVLVEVL
jgi:protein phosphatase